MPKPQDHKCLASLIEMLLKLLDAAYHHALELGENAKQLTMPAGQGAGVARALIPAFGAAHAGVLIDANHLPARAGGDGLSSRR